MLRCLTLYCPPPQPTHTPVLQPHIILPPTPAHPQTCTPASHYTAPHPSPPTHLYSSLTLYCPPPQPTHRPVLQPHIILPPTPSPPTDLYSSLTLYCPPPQPTHRPVLQPHIILPSTPAHPHTCTPASHYTAPHPSPPTDLYSSLTLYCPPPQPTHTPVLQPHIILPSTPAHPHTCTPASHYTAPHPQPTHRPVLQPHIILPPTPAHPHTCTPASHYTALHPSPPTDLYSSLTLYCPPPQPTHTPVLQPHIILPSTPAHPQTCTPASHYTAPHPSPPTHLYSSLTLYCPPPQPTHTPVLQPHIILPSTPAHPQTCTPASHYTAPHPSPPTDLYSSLTLYCPPPQPTHRPVLQPHIILPPTPAHPQTCTPASHYTAPHPSPPTDLYSSLTLYCPPPQPTHRPVLQRHIILPSTPAHPHTCTPASHYTAPHPSPPTDLYSSLTLYCPPPQPTHRPVLQPHIILPSTPAHPQTCTPASHYTALHPSPPTDLYSSLTLYCPPPQPTHRPVLQPHIILPPTPAHPHTCTPASHYTALHPSPPTDLYSSLTLYCPPPQPTHRPVLQPHIILPPTPAHPHTCTPASHYTALHPSPPTDLYSSLTLYCPPPQPTHTPVLQPHIILPSTPAHPQTCTPASHYTAPHPSPPTDLYSSLTLYCPPPQPTHRPVLQPHIILPPTPAPPTGLYSSLTLYCPPPQPTHRPVLQPHIILCPGRPVTYTLHRAATCSLSPW